MVLGDGEAVDADHAVDPVHLRGGREDERPDPGFPRGVGRIIDEASLHSSPRVGKVLTIGLIQLAHVEALYALLDEEVDSVAALRERLRSIVAPQRPPIVVEEPPPAFFVPRLD